MAAQNKPGYGIAAAGGVVWREAGPGQVEVALIHRNRYDDWTLPKGKLKPGETELLGAVREVGEEIGSRVAVQRRLGRGGYRVGRESKSVAFWTMQHRGGRFRPGREVDRMQWIEPVSARTLLSYPLDVDMLDHFADTPVPDSVVVIVRHAKAGRRADWSDDDRLRPLEQDGRRQARRLSRLLPCFAPELILSADRARCTQTMEPTAQLLGLPIGIRSLLSDEAVLDDAEPALEEIRTLAKAEPSSIVCSQGKAIPILVSAMAPVDAAESYVARKAGIWVLSFADGIAVAADYYEDAAR